MSRQRPSPQRPVRRSRAMIGSVVAHASLLLATAGPGRAPATAEWSMSVAAPSRPLELEVPVHLTAPDLPPAPEFAPERTSMTPELQSTLPEPTAEPPADEPLIEPAPPVLPAPPPPTAWTVPLPRRADPPPSGGATAQPEPPPTEPTPADADAIVEPSPRPGHNPAPRYPFLAWQRGIEGTVVVLLEIDVEGRVTAAHIEQSSGSALLDDTALATLSTWLLEPARRGAVAVPGTYRKIVEFRLQ